MIDLKDLFLSRQKELFSKHSTIKQAFDHPTMIGDANEQMWIDLLSDFLPKRYSISSGKVVDHTGRVSQQIDVLIFDQYFSPIIFRDQGKCVVPAESVYCAFEVNPSLNKKHIEYAAEKAASVRGLKRTAVQIPVAGDGLRTTKNVDISCGLLCVRSEWSPPYGEPFKLALTACSSDQCLDIGCTLDSGTFAADLDGSNLVTTAQDLSLIAFLTLLMQKLQAKGTAGAIDYQAYGAHPLGFQAPSK